MKLWEKINDKVNDSLKINISIVESEGRIGSGAYPTFPVKSLSISIAIPGLSAEKTSRKFRQNKIPIFGYIENEQFYINLLSIHDSDIDIIANTINLP